ncbi:hypothetical protein [Wolbachia endosymbiont of Ctenocephalides felis wCfeJ]|nr:hypothetical protein [Wolbachia endosymbiont of Ctenocephalides felis wCfeJ]
MSFQRVTLESSKKKNGSQCRRTGMTPLELQGWTPSVTQITC